MKKILKYGHRGHW